MKKALTTIVLAALAFAVAGATVPYKFDVPDIPGYVTLTGDFHVHTVFSDCTTWPTTRVVEAYYDDLDMLAITDHLDTRHRKMVNRGRLPQVQRLKHWRRPDRRRWRHHLRTQVQELHHGA